MFKLLIIKLKKKNKKNFDQIYRNIIKKNKIQKTKNNIFTIKKNDTLIIANNTNFYIDKENLYFLEGIPTLKSKKISIKFFMRNKDHIDELYNNKIYGSWKFSIVNKKNGFVSIFQNILSHKPSYYLNNSDLFIYSSDLRSIQNSNLVDIKKNDAFKFLYIFNNYKSVYGRKICPLVKISQLKFNENLIFTKKLKIYKIKKNNSDIYDVKNKQNNVNFNFIIQNIEKQILDSCGAFENEKNCISLSGGLDSAILVFHLKKLFKKKLNSVSLIFDEKNQYNEIENIKILEKKFIKNYHRLTFKPKMIENDLEKSYQFFDSPIPTISFFGFYKIFSLASTYGYKNIFTGYGADAACCGYYEHYLYNLSDLKNTKNPYFLNEKKEWIKKHSTKEFKKNNSIFKKFLKNLNENLIDDRIISLTNLIKPKVHLHKNDCSNYYFTENRLDNYSINSLNLTSISPSKDTDQSIELLENINIINPFSNIEFINLFLRLNNSEKIYNAENKYILRNIYSNRISRKIFKSKKVGFNMPLNKWINNELKDFFKDNLLSKECLSLLDIKKNIIEKLFKENQNGINHGMLFWQLINYYFWIKKI